MDFRTVVAGIAGFALFLFGTVSWITERHAAARVPAAVGFGLLVAVMVSFFSS